MVSVLASAVDERRRDEHGVPCTKVPRRVEAEWGVRRVQQQMVQRVHHRTSWCDRTYPVLEARQGRCP